MDYQKQIESFVCWHCHGRTDETAMFCNHCGSVQNVRAADHFARLGLERRLDVNVTDLDDRFNKLRKPLDPNFFMIRSTTERNFAARQLIALVEAYETLRDPVQRGRYWLKLHQQDFVAAKNDHPVVQKMRAEFDNVADDTAQLDMLAQRTNALLQNGVMKLLTSLRQQNWEEANQALVELDGMEDILSQTRARRQGMTKVDPDTEWSC
ncbi:MAG: hypothetical protein EBQ89_08050 [Alphaproteobacteria bacterium]|nr:hypothetical protein [Alphaproteobacteria bacterium]